MRVQIGLHGDPPFTRISWRQARDSPRYNFSVDLEIFKGTQNMYTTSVLGGRPHAPPKPNHLRVGLPPPPPQTPLHLSRPPAILWIGNLIGILQNNGRRPTQNKGGCGGIWGGVVAPPQKTGCVYILGSCFKPKSRSANYDNMTCLMFGKVKQVQDAVQY